MATLILGGIISGVIIYIIALKLNVKDLEKTFSYSFPLAVTLGGTIFYIIRRRFNFKITLVQIVLSSLITFMFIYAWTFILGYLPDYYTYESAYLFLLIAVIAVVLTKHLTDKIIISKFKYADT